MCKSGNLSSRNKSPVPRPHFLDGVRPNQDAAGYGVEWTQRPCTPTAEGKPGVARVSPLRPLLFLLADQHQFAGAFQLPDGRHDGCHRLFRVLLLDLATGCHFLADALRQTL